MKIKNSTNYFKEEVLKYFKMSTKFLNISEWKYFIVHPYTRTWRFDSQTD